MNDNTFHLKYNNGRSKPVSFKAYNNADELEKLAKLKNSGTGVC
jgi:hypothetical protein